MRQNANRELRRHLLSLCYVDQKDGEQGRYRFPVVILHQEEPQVQILPLYSKWRGKKEYDEMKEEVSSILGFGKNYQGKKNEHKSEATFCCL